MTETRGSIHFGWKRNSCFSSTPKTRTNAILSHYMNASWRCDASLVAGRFN